MELEGHLRRFDTDDDHTLVREHEKISGDGIGLFPRGGWRKIELCVYVLFTQPTRILSEPSDFDAHFRIQGLGDLHRGRDIAQFQGHSKSRFKILLACKKEPENQNQEKGSV